MQQLLYVSLCVYLLSIAACLQPHIPVTCKRITPCVCQDETGKYVDLRPLARNDGTPKFTDFPTAGGESNLYSFNPCYNFSEGNDHSSCKDVAVCQVNKEKTKFRGIGDQSTAEFGHDDNGNLSVIFHSRDGKFVSHVVLYCAEEVEGGYFRVIGDIGNNNFWLQLRSKHCCPKNVSGIADIDGILNIDGTDADRQDITMPSMPPHVVTMTSKPHPTIPPSSVTLMDIMVFSILVVLILILVFLVIGIYIYLGRHNQVGKSVEYQRLINEVMEDHNIRKGNTLQKDVYVGNVDHVFSQIPQTCKKLSPCVCEDELGHLIDLRPLGNNNGTPRFLNYKTASDKESYLYSFNPCYDFNEGSNAGSCRNVSVCQVNGNKTEFKGIGFQENADFTHFDDGNLSLVFQTPGNNKTTYVVLHCQREEEQQYFRVIGDVGKYYWLQLWSKHCCPQNGTNLTFIGKSHGIKIMKNDTGNGTIEGVASNLQEENSTSTSSFSSGPGVSRPVLITLFCVLALVLIVLAVLVAAVSYYKLKGRSFNAPGRSFYYKPMTADSEEDLEKHIEFLYN